MSGYDTGETAATYAEDRMEKMQRPAQPDGVIAQLHDLDGAADELDSALGRLFDRITPALRPDNEQDKAGDVGAIRPPASDMREHAERITRHLRQLRRLTLSITDRVDL